MGIVGVILVVLAYLSLPIAGTVAAKRLGGEIQAQTAQLKQSLQDKGEIYTPYSQLPKCVVDATVAVEDQRFFETNAIDPIGLVRAGVINIQNRKVVQGGGSITQQLARRLIPTERNNFTENKENRWKILGYSLALQHDYSKQQIFEMYVNFNYYGRQADGVAAAAQAYFSKPLNKLSMAECTYLGGLPLAPSTYGDDPSGTAAHNRYLHVVERLQHNGYVSQDDANKLSTEKLVFRPM